MTEQAAAKLQEALASGALEFTFDIETTPDELARLGVSCTDEARAACNSAAATHGLEVGRWCVTQDNANGCCFVECTLQPKNAGAIDVPELAEDPALYKAKRGRSNPDREV